MILVENVWNQMFYEHSAPPEQPATAFVKFIDSFNSPWVGMYYDIGNHWKYGQPGDWIREFGRRCVKLDVKGFSRAKHAEERAGPKSPKGTCPGIRCAKRSTKSVSPAGPRPKSVAEMSND